MRHTQIQGVSARLRLGCPEKAGKMRKSLWIMLAVLLVAIGAPIAHADTFSFSFSNTIGNTPGIVTGTLTFTGTGTFTGQAATAITLTSAPSAFTSQLPISDFLNLEFLNSFSAVDGVMTAASLDIVWVGGSPSAFSDTLFLNVNLAGSPVNLLENATGGGTLRTENNAGLAGVTFTDTTLVPEPSSVALA